MTAPDARAARAQAQTTARTVAAPKVKPVGACPRCGAAVLSETADFCESCAAHLYPGHCVFCLEPCGTDQAHCRSCGLPPDGVVCESCGTFSRFDFCPECQAGLTPRAAEELKKVAADPEAREAFAELDEISSLIKAVETGSPLAPAPAASTTPAAVVAVPSPAAVTRPNLAALRAAAAGARSAQDKAKVRALAQQAAQDALNAVSSREFPSAQEARAAGTALQVALRFRESRERLEVIAWRCHAYSCEHPMPGGMSLCSDPSRGGVPLTRIIVEVHEGSAEFTV